MRRVGDYRAFDPHMLAAQRHAPRNRAAPIMADNSELRDIQRVRQ